MQKSIKLDRRPNRNGWLCNQIIIVQLYKKLKKHLLMMVNLLMKIREIVFLLTGSIGINTFLTVFLILIHQDSLREKLLNHQFNYQYSAIQRIQLLLLHGMKISEEKIELRVLLIRIIMISNQAMLDTLMPLKFICILIFPSLKK